MADRGVRAWLAGSLRARLTVAAALVLALGLCLGAVLLSVTLTHSLTSALDASARRTASDVAALGQPPPNPLPVGDGNTVAVQVLDQHHNVVAASATADHLVPLLDPAELARVRSGEVLVLPGDRAGVNGSLRVVGRAAGSSGQLTVVVAVDASQAGESGRVLRRGLLIGLPILLVLIAAVAWRVVGRTLRPVEDLRAGAEQISQAGAAARRLPVPAGTDEVHRLALTLNHMLQRLDAASAKQRAFVADAAHELRSPLASLRAQLEVAAHLGERADWPATAEGALVDIARLSRLVDDLLLLARLDERRPAKRPATVDVAAVVADVVGDYANGRVPVRFAADGPALIRGDADAVRRIARNLLDNAVRHANTQVAVATQHASRRVVLTVTDDGPGIAAADRERVFDRFTRLDDARGRDAGGSGLGLPIVRELTRAHGGTVTLNDAAPGLRATVRLPAAPPAGHGTSTTPDRAAVPDQTPPIPA